MNDIQRGILLLFRSGITGETYNLPEGFSIGEAEPIIRKHTIVPLAYQGAVQCGVPAGEPAMQRMFQQYCRAMLYSERQMKAVDTVFRCFEENGIDYMPLKGCKMKALYPRPELRSMGDADVLIRMEQYGRIRPLMQKLGFAEGLESDHELIWKSESLYLELHKQLMASRHGEFHSYCADSWALAKPVSGTRYAFSREDEFIYLFIHFAKHYRGSGIGCRHMVDLWVYRRANPDMDEEYIRSRLEQIHLYEFYRNIVATLHACFEDGEPDEKTDFITDFIFACGNWGTLENRMLSGGARRAKTAGSAGKGRMRYFLRSVFPSKESMVGLYPILKNKPCLLPACWLRRLVRLALFERRKVRRNLAVQMAATPEKIETHRQALNYVGIDFWEK